MHHRTVRARRHVPSCAPRPMLTMHHMTVFSPTVMVLTSDLMSFMVPHDSSVFRLSRNDATLPSPAPLMPATTSTAGFTTPLAAPAHHRRQTGAHSDTEAHTHPHSRAHTCFKEALALADPARRHRQGPMAANRGPWNIKVTLGAVGYDRTPTSADDGLVDSSLSCGLILCLLLLRQLAGDDARDEVLQRAELEH